MQQGFPQTQLGTLRLQLYTNTEQVGSFCWRTHIWNIMNNAKLEPVTFHNKVTLSDNPPRCLGTVEWTAVAFAYTFWKGQAKRRKIAVQICSCTPEGFDQPRSTQDTRGHTQDRPTLAYNLLHCISAWIDPTKPQPAMLRDYNPPPDLHQFSLLTDIQSIMRHILPHSPITSLAPSWLPTSCSLKTKKYYHSIAATMTNRYF